MQIDSSHTFHCHTVSFRFVVFVSSDNNVLPEGNLPSHFALNVYQSLIFAVFWAVELRESQSLPALSAVRGESAGSHDCAANGRTPFFRGAESPKIGPPPLTTARLARLGGFEGVDMRKCLKINARIF